MRLTPEEVLDEAPAQETRGRGGGKPKKETRRQRRNREKEEEPEYEMPEEDDGYEEDEDAGETGKRDMAYKAKMFVLLLIVTVGLVLFAVNMKGFVDSMRIDNVDYSTESMDGADEDAAEGDGVGAGPDAQPQEDAGSGTENSTQPQETGEGGTGDRAQADGTGSVSKQEAEKLKQEAQDAKNAAATMEQELNNTKALLEASQAREAQLRNAQENAPGTDDGK